MLAFQYTRNNFPVTFVVFSLVEISAYFLYFLSLGYFGCFILQLVYLFIYLLESLQENTVLLK